MSRCPDDGGSSFAIARDSGRAVPFDIILTITAEHIAALRSFSFPKIYYIASYMPSLFTDDVCSFIL